MARRAEMPDVPLKELSDEQLIGCHMAGRKGAFEALMGRYHQELYHFLIRFVGQRAAADDIYQEAFLQIHLSADTFDLSKRFKPWLFTIAANKARDYLRKRNRYQAAPLSAAVDGQQDDGRSYIDLMEADVADPVEQVTQDETRQRVRQAVDELPDHLREVLILAYFNRLAYKEIAERLNIPLGTVKSRLHAAVGTFAQVWKARYHDEDFLNVASTEESIEDMNDDE